MVDFTVVAGSVLRLLFLGVSFVPLALLASKYDRAGGGLKKSFKFIAAYFLLAAAHYFIWEYVLFFRSLPGELSAEISPILLISAILLVAGVSFLHFGISRLNSQLFSEDVSGYRFIAGLFSATTGLLVIVESASSGGVFSAILKGLYVSSWVSLSASYVLLTNLYRKFGTKYAYLGYIGAVSASANIVIFLLATSGGGTIFFELRFLSYIFLLAGGIFAAAPGAFLLKDLLTLPERVSERTRTPLYSFIHKYAERYGRVIGAVSYSLCERGVAAFRETSGNPDFVVEKGRPLSRESSQRLLKEIFSSYWKITGQLAKKIAEDLLSDDRLLSDEKEISSAVRAALSEVIVEQSSKSPGKNQ
ncbi:MAG: hypothetical protein V1820_06570 [archaeon]